MAKLPVWARKPKHKQKVIATDRGWLVEETGEILKRVNDLPAKLKELFSEVKELETVEIVETGNVASDTSSGDPLSHSIETKDEQNELEKGIEHEVNDGSIEEKPAQKKRRGRKKKTD